MKSTDEMILDLVAAGFVLPKDVCRHYDPAAKADCFALQMRRSNGGRQCWVLISDQQAHDLCAMEFARELTHGKRNNARALGLLGDPLDLFREWLGKGNTEAAIKALWDGVCGCTTKKNA